MVEILGCLGSEKVWFVYGLDGMDELIIIGVSWVLVFEMDGVVKDFEFYFEEVGFLVYFFDFIVGGMFEENVIVFCVFLVGEVSVYWDVVFLNVVFVLLVVDVVSDLKEGVVKVVESIDSGVVKFKVEVLVWIIFEVV